MSLRLLPVLIVLFLIGYVLAGSSGSQPMGSGPAIALSLGSMAFVFPLFLILGTRRQLRRRADLPLVETTLATFSAELREKAAEMEALGFSVDGPALLTAPGMQMRWQPFKVSDRRCMASVSERGPSFSIRYWDFDSLLSDGRWLMTLNDPAALSLPTHPGFLVQVLPGTTVPELFRHHQEALRALEATGLTVQPIADDYKTVTQTMVRALYQHATMMTAAKMLWRGLTKRSPHRGALAARGLQAGSVS